MSAQSDRYEQGLHVRREVLGDDHVDAALARTTEIDAPFEAYITGAPSRMSGAGPTSTAQLAAS